MMRACLKPFAFIFLSLGICACSNLSVGHLQRIPLVMDASRAQALEMKFARFEYKDSKSQDGIRISGTAFVREDKVPYGFEWLSDVWFAAYLCDEEGNVVGSQVKGFPPQMLDYRRGIDFDFLVKPRDADIDARLYITFGYGMMLSTNRFASPGVMSEIDSLSSRADYFYASESALVKL